MSINKEQFRELVVIPTLKKIPHGYSQSAVFAVMMIVAHESLRGHYIKQVNGPALGLGNIEPDTYDSVWLEGDTVWVNAFKLGFVSEKEHFFIKECKKRFAHGSARLADNIKEYSPPAERMNVDLTFTVFMIRQRLFMKPEALPKHKDQISRYLKKHWNSAGGAADELSYLHDYDKW